MKTISFEVKTHRRDEMIDVTSQVAEAVTAAGTKNGVALVFVPHTTAAVTINENADPDVVHDMLAALDVAVPHTQPFYQHNEGNSAAHVKSSLVGSSVSVPVQDGQLTLGTWQGIYFCEFDGPRTRRCVVTVG